MTLPPGYSYEEPSEWPHTVDLGWISFLSSNLLTPNCVPKLLRGNKKWAYEIHHKMDCNCSCPENYDKEVFCTIRLSKRGEPEIRIYGIHLPGECPGMKYRPSRGKSKVIFEPKENNKSLPK